MQQRDALNSGLSEIKTAYGAFLVQIKLLSAGPTFLDSKMTLTKTSNLLDAHARLSINEPPQFGNYLFQRLEREKDDITYLEFLVNKITI